MGFGKREELMVATIHMRDMHCPLKIPTENLVHFASISISNFRFQVPLQLHCVITATS